jgi:ATP-binding cassette subfamily F protein uup
LVTHDRYMLDRVSNVVLGLNGLGHAERFADYLQWEAWQDEQVERSKSTYARTDETSPRPVAASGRKKLSYLEAREYATIEQHVADAEEVLRAKQTALEDPAIVSDAAKILVAHADYDAAKAVVDELYIRWAELDSKIS